MVQSEVIWTATAYKFDIGQIKRIPG